VGCTDWELLDAARLRAFECACGGGAAAACCPAATVPLELLLALSAPLGLRLMAARVRAQHVVNIGTECVRYGAEVPAPAWVRGRLSLLDVQDKRMGRLLVRTAVQIEVRGRPEPAVQGTVTWLLQAWPATG
jgi:hypothetical protein